MRLNIGSGVLTIAKSEETIKLERDIFEATNKTGIFGCFEVTIGWWGDERVDYITYDTKGVWRCYEIKVSKSDFYSKARKSFVGHYNYFVLTKELYEQVKGDIPKGIGCYVEFEVKKRASKQELGVNEQTLKDSMIRSLSREFQKQYADGNPLIVEGMKKQLRNIKKERDQLRNEYKQTIDLVRSKYGRDWWREEAT